MTRNVRRIQLAPAYILHHHPYRDTSRILEVITREHGRLSLFARGVRGPKAKLASILNRSSCCCCHGAAGAKPRSLLVPKAAITGLPCRHCV
jgi:recombinational DNA repair protein (RecF pathway)